jgi:hypothetical protein
MTSYKIYKTSIYWIEVEGYSSIAEHMPIQIRTPPMDQSLMIGRDWWHTLIRPGSWEEATSLELLVATGTSIYEIEERIAPFIIENEAKLQARFRAMTEWKERI